MNHYSIFIPYYKPQHEWFTYTLQILIMSENVIKTSMAKTLQLASYKQLMSSHIDKWYNEIYHQSYS